VSCCLRGSTAFFAELHLAIRITASHGLEAAGAIEKGLRGMVAPLSRGKAGGLARAQSALRYSDGTFMSEDEHQVAIEEFQLAKYERYAAGGRARAATALRAPDGTFART